MELPIIQQGRRKLITIREGEVFLLPSRVPHAPQRPEAGSLGLVVERSREEGVEYDGLRWYVDFETATEILYEKYFFCYDLGRDLVPVVKEYMSSEEYKSRKPGNHRYAVPPLKQDYETTVPEPFNFQEWLQKQNLESANISLFGDKEFDIRVISGPQSTRFHCPTGESMWYQLKGPARFTRGEAEDQLKEGEIGVIPINQPFMISMPAGAYGLYLGNNPKGNKH